MKSPTVERTPAVKGVRGLYAITPQEESTERLLDLVRLAIEGGASVIQYRNKQATAAQQLSQAQALRSLTRAYNVPLIINDGIALALSVDADGAHLGRDDGDTAAARAQLCDKLLGVSCYDDLAQAEAAQSRGADYVAFGAAFSSPTKPTAVHAAFSLFRQAHRLLHVPIVAIGGITLENAPALVETGIDAVAVISALFGAADVRATARRFSLLFEGSRHADPQ
jgi:thiamine-phosphate pyrophosphorylase